MGGRLIDAEYAPPRCCESGCGNSARPHSVKSFLGFTKYRKRCRACETKRVGDGKRNAYRRHKGDMCERCGFVPVHRVQLEVDHIDGNHSNNAKENLQTLCANCHRLKTYAPSLFGKV